MLLSLLSDLLYLTYWRIAVYKNWIHIIPMYNKTLKTEIYIRETMESHTIHLFQPTNEASSNHFNMTVIKVPPLPPQLLVLYFSLKAFTAKENNQHHRYQTNRSRRLTNSNLTIQPVPRALILYRDKRTISTALERNAHTSALFGDGLDICQPDIPFDAKLFGAHKHDPIIG